MLRHPQKNVLLVYPEFPETFWSFKHALKFIGKRAAFPPLGLLTVAAMLPAAWKLRLVDLNVSRLEKDDLEWADLVLLSAMITQRDSANDLIYRFHQAGKTIVAGGPLFTTEPERFPLVHHLVLNEAETNLPPFLADFAAGTAKRIYATAQHPDLRATPAPRWDLINLNRYASMSLQYSRGCPFDCEFCSVTALLGHRPRVKSPAQVIAELEALWESHWRGPVFFVDDNFIGNKKALRTQLLPDLIEWKKRRPDLSFYTEASINLADDSELMRLIVEAGFDQVFIGIETPEETSLAECNKRQNRGRDLIDDIKRIHRAGLQVQGGFIVGFDNDPPNIFQRQFDFIQSSGIVTAMVGLLQAVPGTRLHQRLHQQGRLLGPTSGNNSDGSTNFVSSMDPSQLGDGYHRLVDRLYSPSHYYRRVRTFLREFSRSQPTSPKSRFNLLAFSKAAIRLGIIGRERLHFWGLLFWTVSLHPRLLALAVTLSIYGFHFRKCGSNLAKQSLHLTVASTPPPPTMI